MKRFCLLIPRLLCLLFVWQTAGVVWAQERLGDFEIRELTLEPSFVYGERRTGEFQLGDSLLGVLWQLNPMISGHFAVGTARLVAVPARYGVTDPEQLTLVEAFGQLESFIGQFRLGLQPIPFGSEGGWPEARLRFPRTMIFERRIVGLRDIGLGYRVQNLGFFSEWLVHNGEGGPDLDNQAWFTARVGWRGQPGIRGGFSGQTGRTTPESTLNPARLAALEPLLQLDASSRIRIGNLFFESDRRPFAITLDYNFGEVQQQGTNFNFTTGHLDLYYRFPKKWGILLRYEEFDPNDRVKDDKTLEATAGISFRDRHENSVFYLFGTKVMQEGPRPDSHRALFVWRLTPKVSM